MGEQAPLVVVVGPTAAGKSELAIAVAEWFDGEVISADALQIYRGLDIGTGKIGADAARSVRHHAIDIADPDEQYTAGRYARQAAASIVDIRSRRRLPVIAGGSGFYIRALIEGLAPLPEHDERWRSALGRLEKRRGLRRLFAILRALDPDWAQAVGPSDRQRILRGLEVTLRLGVPMSIALERQGSSGPQLDAVWVGVSRPRPQLNERIEQRVDEMLAAGWLDEVRSLLDRGYTATSPAMRAIGYRQLVAHLAGDITLDEARESIVRSTRQYAKRQMTWFRHQSPAVFFELEDDGEAVRAGVHAQIRAHLEEKLACYRNGTARSSSAPL